MDDKQILQYILQNKHDKAIQHIKIIINMYSYSKTLPFLLCVYLLLFPKEYIDEVLRLILSKCNIVDILDAFEDINNHKYEEKLLNYIQFKNKMFPQYNSGNIKLSEKELEYIQNLLTTTPLYYKLNDDISEYNISIYIHNTYDIYELLSIDAGVKFTIHIMELYKQNSELVKLLNDLDEDNVNIVYMVTLYDELSLQLLEKIKITERLFLIVCNRCSNNVIKHIMDKDVKISTNAFKNVLCRSITVLYEDNINTIYFYISKLFTNLTLEAFRFNIFNKRNKTTMTYNSEFKPVPAINLFLCDHNYKPTKSDLLSCLKYKLYIKNPENYNIYPEKDRDIRNLCKKINYDPYLILESSKIRKYKQMDINTMTEEQICTFKDVEEIDKYYEKRDTPPNKKCIQQIIERCFIDLFISWVYRFSLPLDDSYIELLVKYSNKKELVNILKLFNRQYEDKVKNINVELMKKTKENMDLKFKHPSNVTNSATSSPINIHSSLPTNSPKSIEESSNESNIVKPTNITILTRKVKDKIVTIKIHP